MNEEQGVLSRVPLPDKGMSELWQRIIAPKSLKDSLLSQVLLEFTLRGQFPAGALPLHGIILLVGPPGTGKTTLAKGVASVAASLMDLGQKVQFVEAEPHSLTSSALGKSQRAVQSFFQEKIAELAAQGPLIVLLDEVETLAADRSKMSLEANPVDVHRATDAVLASLDALAAKFPRLLFIATSNFEGAIDAAFLSRADMVLRVEKPEREACAAILRDTIETLGGKYLQVRAIIEDPAFESIVDEAVGLDGRQIRKSLLHACALDKEVALDPNLLRAEHLLAALRQVKEAQR